MESHHQPISTASLLTNLFKNISEKKQISKEEKKEYNEKVNNLLDQSTNEGGKKIVKAGFDSLINGDKIKESTYELSEQDIESYKNVAKKALNEAKDSTMTDAQRNALIECKVQVLKRKYANLNSKTLDDLFAELKSIADFSKDTVEKAGFSLDSPVLLHLNSCVEETDLFKNYETLCKEKLVHLAPLYFKKADTTKNDTTVVEQQLTQIFSRLFVKSAAKPALTVEPSQADTTELVRSLSPL